MYLVFRFLVPVVLRLAAVLFHGLACFIFLFSGVFFWAVLVFLFSQFCVLPSGFVGSSSFPVRGGFWLGGSPRYYSSVSKGFL